MGAGCILRKYKRGINTMQTINTSLLINITSSAVKYKPTTNQAQSPTYSTSYWVFLVEPNWMAYSLTDDNLLGK